MILNIEFDGYKFFDNSSISFTADARTKKLLSNSTELDGKNVLKAVGLYGSNNSGKTNIIILMSLIKKVLIGADNISFNNLVFKDSIETSISITFNNLNEKGWLKYEFTYNNEKKQYEREKLISLSFYDSGNVFQKVIFEKDTSAKILNVFDVDQSKFLSIIPSRLPFLYSVELESSEFSGLNDYLTEFKTLAASIQIIKMYDIPFENTLDTMKKNDTKKINFIKEFVKNADISINNFEFDKDINAEIGGEINEQALSRFSKESDTLKLITTYGDVKVPSFIFDSTGTKKVESIASYIYDAIVDGKTLIIDEIDNGLHYKLTRSIVSIFNNMLNTKGQLFFVTHDLLLIDCNKLMRKDQIYFINRTSQKADLYCLKEATVSEGGPREVNDIVKLYNRGEFVSVPNPEFIDLIAEVLLNE